MPCQALAGMEWGIRCHLNCRMTGTLGDEGGLVRWCSVVLCSVGRCGGQQCTFWILLLCWHALCSNMTHNGNWAKTIKTAETASACAPAQDWTWQHVENQTGHQNYEAEKSQTGYFVLHPIINQVSEHWVPLFRFLKLHLTAMRIHFWLDLAVLFCAKVRRHIRQEPLLLVLHRASTGPATCPGDPYSPGPVGAPFLGTSWGKFCWKREQMRRGQPRVTEKIHQTQTTCPGRERLCDLSGQMVRRYPWSFLHLSWYCLVPPGRQVKPVHGMAG